MSSRAQLTCMHGGRQGTASRYTTAPLSCCALPSISASLAAMVSAFWVPPPTDQPAAHVPVMGLHCNGESCRHLVARCSGRRIEKSVTDGAPDVRHPHWLQLPQVHGVHNRWPDSGSAEEDTCTHQVSSESEASYLILGLGLSLSPSLSQLSCSVSDQKQLSGPAGRSQCSRNADPHRVPPTQVRPLRLCQPGYRRWRRSAPCPGLAAGTLCRGLRSARVQSRRSSLSLRTVPRGFLP